MTILIDADGCPEVSDVMKNKTSSRTLPLIRLNLRLLAEMVGFEPTCPIKDKTISSRSRYDRFDTSPSIFSWQIYDLYIANRP